MNYPEYLHLLRMIEKGGELARLGFQIREATQKGKKGQFAVTAPPEYRAALPRVKICAHYEEAVAFAAGVAAGLGIAPPGKKKAAKRPPSK